MTCLTTGDERFRRWVTKKAATVATTSSTNTIVEVCARSAVRIGHRCERGVRDREVGERLGAACGEGAPDRAAVADHERRQRTARDVGEPRLHACGVLLERLAAGEAEVGLDGERTVPASGILRLDVGDQPALPF